MRLSIREFWNAAQEAFPTPSDPTGRSALEF
jgi:hypothetical protein